MDLCRSASGYAAYRCAAFARSFNFSYRSGNGNLASAPRLMPEHLGLYVACYASNAVLPCCTPDKSFALLPALLRKRRTVSCSQFEIPSRTPISNRPENRHPWISVFDVVVDWHSCRAGPVMTRRMVVRRQFSSILSDDFDLAIRHTTSPARAYKFLGSAETSEARAFDLDLDFH